MSPENKANKNSAEKKPVNSGEFLGLTKKQQVLYFPVIFAALVVILALLLAPPRMYGLFIGAAILIGFIPYSLYNYFEAMQLKDIEDNLPAFLREYGINH